MKPILLIVAGLLILTGVIWFFQGMGLLPGSVMTGQGRWALYGGLAFIAGCAALAFAATCSALSTCGALAPGPPECAGLAPTAFSPNRVAVILGCITLTTMFSFASSAQAVKERALSAYFVEA